MMKNELQVIVKVQKGEIAFNFDELKEGVTGIASAYEGATFCDESIPNAKNEIASLRKIRMAIDTRRKEVKKECMLTYEAFEDKVKEIFEIIDKPITDIGRQIEDFELRRIMEKRLLIQGLYANIVEDNEYVTLEYIFNDKWLNKTYKLDDIAKEIEEFLNSTMESVKAIERLNSDAVPNALESFKKDFSLTNAITYVNNYEQQKAEIAQKERERYAKELERQKQAEIERIRQEERKRVLEEQKLQQEAQQKIQEEVFKAKEEVLESMIPDVEEKADTYIYKIQLGAEGKKAFEMYLDSIGADWELM